MLTNETMEVDTKLPSDIETLEDIGFTKRNKFVPVKMGCRHPFSKMVAYFSTELGENFEFEL